MAGLGAFLKAFQLETPEQRAAAAPPVEAEQTDAKSSSTTMPSRASSAAHNPDPANLNIHHYFEIEQVPAEIQKYWWQRYNIWFNYDDGVWMTDDAWFGVTPEPVADKIAEQIANAVPAGKTTIIDAFAGAGGNAIAFAKTGRWDMIFAIEKDPDVLKCAKHNAEVYGVASKIFFIQGDCFEVIKKRFSFNKDFVVFASPTYCGHEVFDLKTMQPYNMHQLYKSFTKVSNEVVLYLPRTSDLNQLAKYVPEGQQIQVAHYCMWGASKALCAYFGNFGPIS
ncbi:RNA cap guanine-N2 methyltransferase [Neofusicoccum parvum]|uniref:RNA cap guanine-N2 methyltransferase n=1 Tax=Neofusicoccum parvum TaxID=310453 RepID=A0ACB5RPR0_9PEZI|nr:RNA cap guanine-N2 methyltransferase [Neofusicoccum parvum]GME35149.1 RNA cap guanine-N2 methyltransferase [Neofusicoccum parvum]